MRGDLRHKIIIQKLSVVENENGFEQETWTDYKTVWAKVENLYGREFFEAAAVQQEKTVKFTIRFTDVTEDMRVLFQGKTYNITFIDNIKYQNRYLEVKAMEV